MSWRACQSYKVSIGPKYDLIIGEPTGNREKFKKLLWKKNLFATYFVEI